MASPKLIVDPGGRLMPPLAVREDRTILVTGDNNVSRTPADVFIGNTVTFVALQSNQSITITFNGSNPFGWSSNTRTGVQGKAFKVTGSVNTSYYYEARLTTTPSGTYPLRLDVK